jgi:hypothetical protein
MSVNGLIPKRYLLLLTMGALSAISGCSSSYTPATAQMAVSSAAISEANGAGGPQYAPTDMNAAQEKITRARKAMRDKDYPLANSLATQAQADAKLAQSKAESAKAKLAADALQEDIRVLREELNRANQ